MTLMREAKQLVDFKKTNSSQFDKESNRLRERKKQLQ